MNQVDIESKKEHDEPQNDVICEKVKETEKEENKTKKREKKKDITSLFSPGYIYVQCSAEKEEGSKKHLIFERKSIRPKYRRALNNNYTTIRKQKLTMWRNHDSKDKIS